MSRRRPRDEAALVLRERRAALEQSLLNRAMRHDKGPLDRTVTRLVAATLPDTSGVAPRGPRILDRPEKVSSDALADRITQESHAVSDSDTTEPTSPTVSATVTVDAPADHVYSLVSDLPRMGEWSPENTGGRWIGRRPGGAVGSRFVGTNAGPRRWWPTTTVVTDARPGRRFAFDTALGPLRAAGWAYDIEPADAGGCTVTESWFDRRPGWLVVVGKHLTGVDDRVAHTRTMLDATLRALKATAERR